MFWFRGQTIAQRSENVAAKHTVPDKRGLSFVVFDGSCHRVDQTKPSSAPSGQEIKASAPETPRPESDWNDDVIHCLLTGSSELLRLLFYLLPISGIRLIGNPSAVNPSCPSVDLRLLWVHVRLEAFSSGYCVI